ncbi:MAG: hypothetical protein D6741_03225 [Planctomycetota bacterium]|nr:MAG: hypothetical protein D6741_03225 [Planctomycetota bacterium]
MGPRNIFRRQSPLYAVGPGNDNRAIAELLLSHAARFRRKPLVFNFVARGRPVPAETRRYADGIAYRFFEDLIMSFLLGYIDPGSGTLILQVLLAGAIGTLAFFSRIKYAVRSWFGKTAPSTEATTSNDIQDDIEEPTPEPMRRAG